MTLLSIAKDVAASVGGIQVPQSVVGNPQYAQLLALIQQSAEDLAKRHDWTILVKTHSFTPVGASEQPNSVPADFDRFAGEPTMCWRHSRSAGRLARQIGRRRKPLRRTSPIHRSGSSGARSGSLRTALRQRP